MDDAAMQRLERQLRESPEGFSGLARHLKITPQAVQQWFTPGPHRTRPRGKRLDDIASYLGTTARQLQYPEVIERWDANTRRFADWLQPLSEYERAIVYRVSRAAIDSRAAPQPFSENESDFGPPEDPPETARFPRRQK